MVADVDPLTERVYHAIAAAPDHATEKALRASLNITETEYHGARDYLVSQGLITRRRSSTGHGYKRGFDLTGRLVNRPAPYTPMTRPGFVNGPDGPSTTELLRVPARPCPICGEPTDDPGSYFPLCATHRSEAIS